MNCFYHQVTLANTRCRACARPLCPACDHRVKAFTYCQDCIVAGVEGLHSGTRPQAAVDVKSPAVAGFLGLIPGLGSAYNGLIIKALVHFAVVVGLWELNDLFDSILFGWAGFAFYVYSIFNAFQDAKRLNAGVNLQAEEEHLKRLLHEKTNVWGTGLIGIGVLAIMRWVLPYPIVGRLWPLLLIALGVYLLFLYRREPKANVTAQLSSEYRTEMPPVISFDPVARDYTQAETRRFDVR
ncbi:MAG TPA: hypothetical protein VFZ34_27445 [Blastocatellia bacterium]|nr:hypothetical protein [Blastocatellia bacterium]